LYKVFPFAPQKNPGLVFRCQRHKPPSTSERQFPIATAVPRSVQAAKPIYSAFPDDTNLLMVMELKKIQNTRAND
jgi:hypothetical protein